MSLPRTSHPLLVGLGPEGARVVGAMAVSRDFGAGEVLLEQGSRGGELLLLLDGEVEIERETPDGTLVPLGRVGPGAVLGVVSAVDGGPRAARCVALRPGSAAALSADVVDSLLRARTPVGQRFQLALIRALGADLRETNRRLALLATVPALGVSPIGADLGE